MTENDQIKRDIIAEVYQSSQFNDCIRKMQPVCLQNDLKNEVALALCETQFDDIIRMHANKTLIYYAVRIVLNLAKSSTSPFYRKYRLLGQLTEFKNKIHPFQRAEIVFNNYSGLTCKASICDSYKIIEHLTYKEYDDSYEVLLNSVHSNLSQISIHKRRILDLYLKLGTYRAVEKETGIPHVSAYKAVRRIGFEMTKIINKE